MPKLPFRISLVVVALLGILYLGTTTSCSRRVYYSSERVYNARKESNKRLKKKGYRNDQHRRSKAKLRRQARRRQKFNKRKYHYGSVKRKKK